MHIPTDLEHLVEQVQPSPQHRLLVMWDERTNIYSFCTYQPDSFSLANIDVVKAMFVKSLEVMLNTTRKHFDTNELPILSHIGPNTAVLVKRHRDGQIEIIDIKGDGVTSHLGIES